MFDWLKSKNKSNFLSIDIHSHLLPALDDGVKTLEESTRIVSSLQSLGLKKIITTPHVIADYYPNNPEIIADGLAKLRQHFEASGIEIEIEAAAEYFIDEHFFKLIQDKENLATFGDQYILMETGFMIKPAFFNELVFELKSHGYKPILAHPERYIYLQENYELIEDLRSTGVLFQLNALSVTGYYSKAAKKLAEYLIDHRQIELIGSDIHNQKQLAIYTQAIRHKLFQKCRQLTLLNNAL